MKKITNGLILAGVLTVINPSYADETNTVINNTQLQTCSVLNQSQFKRYTKNYKVKRGDTISSIASKCNMDIDNFKLLLKLLKNNSKIKSYLIAGEIIQIPKDEDSKIQILEILKKYKKETEIKENNELFNRGEIQELEKKINYNLFPESVQSIGIERLSTGFLGNMNTEFNPSYPPLVDSLWAYKVYCAGTIKSFFLFSKNSSDRNINENKYVNKEGIDAWTLAEELKSIGYKQEFNLMTYFNEDKIGYKEIIDDENKEDFYQKEIEIGDYLKRYAKPGTMLFMYFKLSNYKWIVKEYNKGEKKKHPNYSPHINTHQALFIGNGNKQFKAEKVKKLSENNGDIDIIDYITYFIQQRSGYKSGLTKKTKENIISNINKFYSLINISINGIQISLKEELEKEKKDRIKIKKNDVINISGPVFIDGFHDANSKNKYISKNNHVRTRFYFEFIIIGVYTPSELMIPNETIFQRNNINNNTDTLINDLEITNFYYLKRGENIDLKLRESILRYKLGKGELLKESKEELDLINKIEDIKISLRHNKYNNKLKIKLDSLIRELIELQERKIKSIKLSKQEEEIFNEEYNKQIKGLQLIGFMQHPGKLNKGTTNINAPIPYFNTKNIDYLFKKYINQQKEKTKREHPNNISNKSFIKIFFYPGDNFTDIFNQIKNKLGKYTKKYPSFSKIGELDFLKKREFIDKIIDKRFNNKDIDVSSGKIPSMKTILIGLDEINNILESIISTSYIEELPLGEIDKEVVSEITSTKQDYNILAHIITRESYEIGIPKRKLLKIIGAKLHKVSSFGDFQTRMFNLRDKDKALKYWPSKKQIEKAISYINSNKLKEIIDRRTMKFPEIIEADLKLVKRLEKLLKGVNENNRLERGKEIYLILKQLCRYNNNIQLNIIGKIIQTSLTLDKIHEHFQNLNGWLNISGISIDEINNSENLQQRYIKTILTIQQRGEKVTLIGTFENYILRLLEALGENINSLNYPKLEETWNGQIKYDKETIKKRFLFYKKRLSKIKGNDKIKIKLEKQIKFILASNLSAKEIYKLFKNKELSDFLKEKNYSPIIFPTIEEFSNGENFRKLFFYYQKTPTGRKPPSYNYKKIIYGGISGISAGFISLLVLLTIFLKKKRKNK